MTNFELKELNTTANDLMADSAQNLSQLSESDLDSIYGGLDWGAFGNNLLQTTIKFGAEALSEEVAGWFS